MSGARHGEHPRVLVTDGENVGALAVVRALELHGYEPWVAAAHAYAPAFRSRATMGTALVPDPCHTSGAFVDAVAALCRTIRPAAILPGCETGMLALSRYADRLPDDVVLAVPSIETVERATDKAELAELAARAGLRAPPTFSISAAEAGRELPVELPAVIKPRRSQIVDGDGFRGFGVRRADTKAQAVAALRALPEERGLVQHYFSGDLYGLGGVFWGGELVSAVHQRAVRTWPPGCGEMSFAVATPRDAELEQAACRMLLDLGWSGLFQLQFLDTTEGQLLIDLNPRVYGSLGLALGAGQNLAGVWADVVTGRTRSANGSYRTGVRFRNELLDTRALFAAYRAGPHGGAPTHIAANGDPTVNAYFDRGDPKPVLGLAQLVAAKLRARSARGR
ncbi:MAG TPA: ATP-grasp domain-containing protein [Solirubrobacteraceae bacterium]